MVESSVTLFTRNWKTLLVLAKREVVAAEARVEQGEVGI